MDVDVAAKMWCAIFERACPALGCLTSAQLVGNYAALLMNFA